MKTEELKAIGLTDEQVQKVFAMNGADVKREKERADQLQGQLTTAQDGLKAFDGVDVADLKGQITTLQTKLTEQADAFAFDTALDGAIRDAKGRDVRAIRGMLDVAALKASKDRSADIKAALESLAKEKAWAFDTAQSPGVTVTTGAEHGTGGSAGDEDGVAAAFASLNPNLKL